MSEPIKISSKHYKWHKIANEKLGANFIGERNWDEVETHLRVFGHLPTEEEEGGAFICEKEKDKGQAKVEEFIERLCS
jgi:hypothetical protein